MVVEKVPRFGMGKSETHQAELRDFPSRAAEENMVCMTKSSKFFPCGAHPPAHTIFVASLPLYLVCVVGEWPTFGGNNHSAMDGYGYVARTQLDRKKRRKETMERRKAKERKKSAKSCSEWDWFSSPRGYIIVT